MRQYAFFAACFIAASACAAGPSKVTFQHEYDKLSRAFEHKDADGYFAILAPNFRQEMKGHPGMNAAQIKAEFKGQMNRLSNTKWVRTVLTVAPSKGGFDVKVSGHLTANAIGPDGKSHAMALDSVSIDHWNKAMKIEVADVQLFNMTVDGHKVPAR